LSLDVRVFHEQINGFIRQKNLFMPRDYANDEDVSMSGIEYQLKWKPWSGAELVVGQSQIDIGAKVNMLALHPTFMNVSGTPFAAPNLASTLSFSQALPGQVNLTLMHQDSGSATLAGSGSGNQTPITRTDLRLGKSLRWGAQKGELALVVQNLGLPYQDFDPLFTFERRVFVSLRLEN
jgi:iron complex outermembrane receptor protein